MESAGKIYLDGRGHSIDGLSWSFDQPFLIGRDARTGLVLSHPSVGQPHAEVRHSGRYWSIHDLNSDAGTLVNGMRVGASGRKLQRNDFIQCGQLGLLVKDIDVRNAIAAHTSAAATHIKATGVMVRVQAFTRLSWEDGLREQPLDRIAAHARHFLTLVRAGYHLSRIDSVTELLQSLLDDIVAVLDAQRGAILLAEEGTGDLDLKTISGAKSRGSDRHFSRTLADRCFRKGDSLLCAHAGLVTGASQGDDDMRSIICGLLRSPRRRLGVIHLDRGSSQPPFTEDDLRLVDAIAATASVGLESALAVQNLRSGFMRDTAALMMKFTELRDPALASHCQRVRLIAERLASEIPLSVSEKEILPTAALLHEIGTLAKDAKSSERPVSASDRYTGPLLDRIRNATAIAEHCSALNALIPVLRHQHEHWDGSGFPDGLKGEAIPRLARVVALANRLDEMCDDPDGLSSTDPAQVDPELSREAGRRFDPSMVAAVLRIPGELSAVLCPPLSIDRRYSRLELVVSDP